MIRLKRLFARISAAGYGTVEISDTPENAHELLWFCDRYPFDVPDTGDAERLRAQADRYREKELLIDRLLGGDIEPRSFEMALPAREYQRVAATMALETGGLLLADDVGLGKTASAICTMLDSRTLPAVVVTLTHLPKQWEREINRFAPGLKCHIVKKGQPYDVIKRPRKRDTGQLEMLGDAGPDVYILNYAKLAGWAETLGKIARSVVFDECQELRIPGSNKYCAAKHLSGEMTVRMGLSATPIYNYGAEMYAVCDVLRPDCLGDQREFAREWCGYGEQISDPRAFGTYLRQAGIMLRRTRKDVGRELPAVTAVSHYVDSDPHALDAIGGSCAELAKRILAQGENYRGEKMHVSQEFSNALRQATGIAKAPYVAEFVRLLVESGEPVVLYGWHRAVYDIWMHALRDLNPVMYTGSESVPQKNEALRKFVEGESKVFICSLRSGAGLDGLQQVCRVCAFGELDWSPGVHTQCIGRIDRDGQPAGVTAYYLISDEGADPIMADVLGVKRNQAEGVVNPDRELVEDLQVDPEHVKRLAAHYLGVAMDSKEDAA